MEPSKLNNVSNFGTALLVFSGSGEIVRSGIIPKRNPAPTPSINLISLLYSSSTDRLSPFPGLQVFGSQNSISLSFHRLFIGNHNNSGKPATYLHLMSGIFVEMTLEYRPSRKQTIKLIRPEMEYVRFGR